MRYALNACDLRCFQSADGLACRLGFNLTALTPAERRGLLKAVLERMEPGGDGCTAFVDADEEQPV